MTQPLTLGRLEAEILAFTLGYRLIRLSRDARVLWRICHIESPLPDWFLSSGTRIESLARRLVPYQSRPRRGHFARRASIVGATAITLVEGVRADWYGSQRREYVDLLNVLEGQAVWPWPDIDDGLCTPPGDWTGFRALCDKFLYSLEEPAALWARLGSLAAVLFLNPDERHGEDACADRDWQRLYLTRVQLHPLAQFAGVDFSLRAYREDVQRYERQGARDGLWLERKVFGFATRVMDAQPSMVLEACGRSDSGSDDLAAPAQALKHIKTKDIALVLKLRNPTWTKSRIARLLGIHRFQMNRWIKRDPLLATVFNMGGDVPIGIPQAVEDGVWRLDAADEEEPWEHLD
jgi:hypothetical protein